MKKICCVITARPSYSRIKTALQAINNNPDCRLYILLTSSALLDKFGAIDNIIEKDNLKISKKIFNVIEGGNLSTSVKTTSLAMSELSSAFDEIKPDFVITIADRYETLATAVTAAFMNISLVHIQGGEITGSIDEKVRHAVTKLSDYHFVSNKDSHKRLIKMGEVKKNVYITGCPSIDIAKQIRDSQTSINDLDLTLGVGAEIDLDEEYLVVMQHTVTYEHEDADKIISETLNAVRLIDKQVVWFWPNIDTGSDRISKTLRVYRENNPESKIRFIRNLPPEKFLTLIKHSLCLIGNSSVGIRESSMLGVPVVNIGSRQKDRLRGKNVIDVKYKSSQIKSAIEKQIKNGKYKSENIYGDGLSGIKISKLFSKLKPVSEKRISY